MESDLLERAEVACALRTSVTRSGLTQADFARCLGTSPSRFSTYASGAVVPSAVVYLRARNLGADLDRARETGLSTPDGTARAVNRALGEGDEDFALRLVLQARDDLSDPAHSDALVRRVWRQRGRPIKDARFDVLLRAVVAHELKDDAPDWALDARLEGDWVVPDPFRDDAEVRAQTPGWLARTGIFIAERGLVTA